MLNSLSNTRARATPSDMIQSGIILNVPRAHARQIAIKKGQKRPVRLESDSDVPSWRTRRNAS